MGYNLVSGTRHLLATLRKSDLCRCGCQGYCSIFQVWLFYKWSIEAFASGRFPILRHDHTPFISDEDSFRGALAGKPLTKCVIVQIKADWLEYATSMALPRWANPYNPCFRCFCTRDELTNLGNFSIFLCRIVRSQPWTTMLDAEPVKFGLQSPASI